MGALFSRKEILDLLEEYKDVWALQHTLSLMGWDLETYMPEEGAAARGLAFERINLMLQRMLTRKEFLEKLEAAGRAEDLNDYERGVLRVLERSVRYYTRVPPRVVAELSRISSEAPVVWRGAKARSDFDAFKPYLEKIFSLQAEAAEHLGYEEHPYDALLDLYEEGLTTREFSSISEQLLRGLSKHLDKILSEGFFPRTHRLEEESYDTAVMRSANKRILEILGHNPGRLRLDESAHPFTSSMGIRDVRITTRYEGKDFKRTIMSVIHEYGHALYELQIDEALEATPLATAPSLGIHESQSRFWELVIGRSRQFASMLHRRVLSELLWSSDPEDLYKYFNTVRPSLIRVDADEVTYNFHIAVRFEIERLAIAKEIRISDIPELWSSLFEKHLGVRPKNHSEGVLQDIHWSMGSVGYFPTYSIGTIVASQIREAMAREIPDLGEKIYSADFEPIRSWLREKIHRWGATYPPRELLKKALGSDIDPGSFIRYVEMKYVERSI